MMQILGAAGLTIASDRARAADADNPRGYYEHEAVKRIRKDSAFLGEMVGKVVKIVAPLLPALPQAFDYRILFMERDLDEVLTSQRVMLARLDRASGRVDDQALRRAYLRQLRQVKIWMAGQENVEGRFVPHEALIDDPRTTIADLADFLRDCGYVIDAESEGAMGRVVDPSLYRQRGRG